MQQPPENQPQSSQVEAPQDSLPEAPMAAWKTNLLAYIYGSYLFALAFVCIFASFGEPVPLIIAIACFFAPLGMPAFFIFSLVSQLSSPTPFLELFTLLVPWALIVISCRMFIEAIRKNQSPRGGFVMLGLAIITMVASAYYIVESMLASV